jgi:hypothetical protein
MSVSLLASQRARKQLDAFCLQRSQPGSELRCRVEDDSLILQYNGQAVVRLQPDGNRWRIFWCRDDRQWSPWPHLPVCDDIRQVIDELEQAPLHVHWSS